MEGNPSHAVTPPFHSSSSHSFESSHSFSGIKYHGLKKKNYYKSFQTDIIQLSNYIFSISPPLVTVNNIMSFIRIFQFLFPCFIPAYFNYWIENTVDQVTINILSVLCYIIPPSAFFQAVHYLFTIYIIIEFFIIIIVILSSVYLKRFAKLPGFIPPFLYFYHISFGHYLHSIILYSIFQIFSYLTTNHIKLRISINLLLILILLSLICVLFNTFFMINSISQTLVFRPKSLASTTSFPQFIIFTSTILINVFFGLAVYLSKIYQIIFFILNIFLYVISAFSVFYRGGFIETFISNTVLSSSITGAVFTFINLLFIVFEKRATVALLFTFIVFFILMLILNYFLLQNRVMKRLKLLDSIQTDPTNFSYIKDVNQFLLLANTGIKYAHPIVLDLTFFTLGTEKWNSNSYVYLIYAKFISIYPEEALTLKYIYKTVKMQKLGGSAARCIKRQTQMILNQRESGFTSELRSKLNAIRKQNFLTKHKLGHVWDVVIRGNLSEIEVATKRAIAAINETNAEFKHLLHEFPNNRNVTYFYSNFLNEVMADHNLSDEMHRRSRALLPGVQIVEDQTHEYGLKQFPNLPSFIKTQKELPPISSTVETAQPFIQDQSELNIERNRQRDLDQIAGIRRSVETLSIPSIVGTKIIHVFTSLFLFVIPCIAGLIAIEFYIKKLKRPLEFLASLSMLRTYSYQVIAFSLRHVGQSLKIFPEFTEHPEKPPRTFGHTWDTKEQLEHLLELTTNALQEFGSFRTFEESNTYIKQAQTLIFQNSVPYVYYTSPTNTTVSNISIQAAILDFTIQQRMIITAYEITPSILSSGTILNPINNVSPISTNIRDAMHLMIAYLNEQLESVKSLSVVLLIVLITVLVLAFSITLTIELKWIASNKKETFQCLFSLPKNIVSELAENRASRRKENSTNYNNNNNNSGSGSNNSNNQIEEMNKQDENIMKIFNSGGSADDSLSDVSLLVVGTVCILLFAVVSVVLFMLMVKNLTESVRNSAPHLHYLMGSYAMLLSSMNWLHVMLFKFGGNMIPNLDFDVAYSKMIYVFDRSRHYYHLISAGGPSSEEVPFRGFIDGVRNASPTNCSNFDIKGMYQNKISFLKQLFEPKINGTFSKASTKSSFNSLTDILGCSPPDMVFTLIEPIVMYSILPYQKGVIDTIDPTIPAYGSIWIQLITPLYDLFFEPLHNQIVPSISEDLNHIKNQYVPIIATLLIIGIFIEAILYSHIIFIENRIRSVLSLLLHCKPNIIYSSNKITRILSGDFSSQQNDSLDRNKNFFDTVFTSLPDAIMYANTDMIIQNANQSCKHTFGDTELVGKNIRDFFMSSQFSGNIESLFISASSTHTEEISYKTSNSNLILKATSMIACGKFVISCRNVTQSHNYNTLILEEKQNSDKLLSTILPPSLVGRVQEGEKNISFSVQSASILFCDIVNFTPWCGSLPAQKVMSTLNILFKKFDSILDTKPTMTKIKCIGDCYMAAGGIFAEINQPAVHAREVVSFGLQLTREITLINEEINQSLKIRVGVNTGGPIVAGVLGIGKPTFEILGPAINRAQQMEQNGVPMKVHISISVYELICGLNFKFCNRRTIECKGEKVETYLVEP